MTSGAPLAPLVLPVDGALGIVGAVPVLTGASAFTNDPVVEDDRAGVDESGPLTGASTLTSGEPFVAPPGAVADPVEGDELVPGGVPVLMGASAFTNDPVVDDD